MSMRSGIVRWAVAFFLMVLTLFILFPGIASAGCSAGSDEGCPLRINNQVVFDRCFGAPPLGPDAGKPTRGGNQICDILRDSNVIARRLGNGAQSLQNNARKDLDAFANVTFNNAVDRNALKKFNDTNRVLKEIDDDIQAFRNDRQCGSKAAMDVLQKSFETEMQQLKLLGEGIGWTANAATAMTPVPGEAMNISVETARLGELAGAKGGNANAVYNQLKRTVETLNNVSQDLGKLDIAGVNSAGIAVSLGMLPFIAECAGCAGTIAGAAASIVGVAASPSVAEVTCLPTAGTGCIVAAAGAGMGVYSTAIFLVLGSAVCQDAAAHSKDIGGNTEKVGMFFNSVTKLVDDIDKTGRNMEKARTELDLLARELGDQAKPTVDRIKASLEKAGGALENGKKILRERVVPRMQRYVGNRFQIMADQANQLFRCYNNIQKLSVSVTKDVVDAAAEMGQAAANIVDAGKILNNIVRQGSAASGAGWNYASLEWNACDSEEAALHKAIWGVDRGTFDPGKTGGHLAGLAAHPDRIPSIANRVTKLKLREANITPRAVEEGKKAFLNLDQSKLSVGKKFNDAEVLSSNAAKRIAKSRAKSQAKEQIAGAKGTHSSVDPVVIVKPSPFPAPNLEVLKPSQTGR